MPTASPSAVDLAAGVYTLPGTTYLLVVDGPGAHLRLPATGPPSLLDLVAQPAPATPIAPVPTQSSGAPAWLVILLGLAIGGVFYLLYERGGSPAPSPVVPAPVVPTPAPAPIPTPAPAPQPAPGPTRPDWLPTLESSLDRLNTQLQAIGDYAKSRPEPDLTPLTERLDKLCLRLEQAPAAQPAAAAQPAPAMQPAPVYYYPQEAQPRVWVNGQWCTTGTCR